MTAATSTLVEGANDPPASPAVQRWTNNSLPSTAAPQDNSRGSRDTINYHDQNIDTTNGSSLVERDVTNCAAELIAFLQDECTGLTNAALQSEEEAAQARQNSREAMEVAYRYSHRSYNNSSINNVSSTPINVATTATATTPSSAGKKTNKINTNASGEIESKRSIIFSNANNNNNIRNDYKSNTALSEEEDVLALLVEITSLKEQLDTERMKHKHALEDLEVECSSLKQQLEVAEEDATTALEIAREASQQKQQLENYLQTVLEENENLKALLQERQLSNNDELMETTMDTSAAVVPPDMADDGASFLSMEHHNDDDDYGDREGHADLTLGVQSVSNGSTDKLIKPHQPPREIVSFGRNLLMQYRNKIRNGSPIHNGSPYAAAYQHYAASLAKYSEKRQVLMEQMKRYDTVTDEMIPKILLSPSSSATISVPYTPMLTPDNHNRNPFGRQREDTTTIPCESLLKLLKDSATRLQLGQSFILTEGEDQNTDARDIVIHQKDAPSNYTSMESITRSYCKAVEVGLCFYFLIINIITTKYLFTESIGFDYFLLHLFCKRIKSDYK